MLQKTRCIFCSKIFVEFCTNSSSFIRNFISFQKPSRKTSSQRIRRSFLPLLLPPLFPIIPSSDFPHALPEPLRHIVQWISNIPLLGALRSIFFPWRPAITTCNMPESRSVAATMRKEQDVASLRCVLLLLRLRCAKDVILCAMPGN